MTAYMYCNACLQKKRFFCNDCYDKLLRSERKCVCGDRHCTKSAEAIDDIIARREQRQQQKKKRAAAEAAKREEEQQMKKLEEERRVLKMELARKFKKRS